MIANWINEAFFGFDYAILQFCHALAEAAGGIFGPIMEFLAFIGDNGYFSFALAFILLLFPKTRKWGLGVFLSILVGAVFTNLAIKNIVARPRPYASDVAAFKEWWTYAGAHLESEFSFPSGHTTAAMASMTALCLAAPKKVGKWIVAPSILYVILMGAARNYLVVHYPTDVIAAFVVGGIAAIVAVLLAKLIWKLLESRASVKLFAFALEFDIRRLFTKKKNAQAAQETDGDQDLE